MFRSDVTMPSKRHSRNGKTARNVAPQGGGALASAAMTAAKPIPERTELAVEHTWNLEALYGSPSAWEEDLERLESLVAELEAFRGTLTSPVRLAELYEAETAFNRHLERLWVYASNRANEDTSDSERQGRKDRLMAAYVQASGRIAWIEPELLQQDEATLRDWAASEFLAANRYAVEKLIRRKPHTLGVAEETLLSKAGEIFSAPGKTFNLLSNADLKLGTIVDADGNEAEVTDGRYVSYLESPDRRVRADAFGAMWTAYGSVRNTVAATLSSSVKVDNYDASIRGHGSALEASLHRDNIGVGLYDALIEAVHANLPAFHNYMGLRARQLDLEHLDMYDMYVRIVPDMDLRFEWEQVRSWVVDSCAPLGEDYCGVLSSAFDERWIDVYENRGKRSGAYSSGCYDSMPYILLNFDGTLGDVFTTAHELGHSMHTFLANRRQSPRFAGYPIFIAEIASTLDEALLLRHLLAETDDVKFKAALLNHYCDQFKGTVYRQTMFAEFEKIIHAEDQAGTPLTADKLCEIYEALNTTYYGPHVKADPRIALEWARIPHFYSAFYVYKYATSFCASQVFIERVLSGAEGRDAYLGLLEAGGSADPLDLVKAAGVDMTDPSTYAGAFEHFAATVAELESVLGEI